MKEHNQDECTIKKIGQIVYDEIKMFILIQNFIICSTLYEIKCLCMKLASFLKYDNDCNSGWPMFPKTNLGLGFRDIVWYCCNHTSIFAMKNDYMGSVIDGLEPFSQPC